METNEENNVQYNSGQNVNYPAGTPMMSSNSNQQSGHGVYPQNNAQYPEAPFDDEEALQNDSKNEKNEIDYNYEIKKGFIIKTYGILLSQLAISLIFISLTFIKSVKEVILFDINNNPLILVFLIAFSIITLVVFCIFFCCRKFARTVPYNYILLFSFTLCMSFYLSLVCAEYDTKIVLTALALTCASTLGLTLYAWTTSADFSMLGGILFALILNGLFSYIIFFFFWPELLYVFSCFFGVLMYSIYIVYDTQLILGKFGVEYNIDDYCFAALNLYIDIIELFIRILYLVASLNKKN